MNYIGDIFKYHLMDGSTSHYITSYYDNEWQGNVVIYLENLNGRIRHYKWEEDFFTYYKEIK